MSRRALAEKLQIHVSSLSAWEAGIRLPRPERCSQLAWFLGVDIESLLPKVGSGAGPDSVAVFTASLIEPLVDLPNVLVASLSRTARQVRAFRFSAPYATSAYVQMEWRKLVDQRLRAATLRVERAEIVYGLDRLQEILSNIIRYDGLPYYVKVYCTALDEVAPFMGGYMFDDKEVLLSAYWMGEPPIDQPSLRFSGSPFLTFFNAYWNEIWRRGCWLNSRGSHDLSAVRETAIKLGLEPSQWPAFVDAAQVFEVGDNSPPLF
jgi:Helix-turn-helix.